MLLCHSEEVFDYEEVKDELPQFEPQATDVIDIMDTTTFKALQSSVTLGAGKVNTVHEVVSLSGEDSKELKNFSDVHLTAPIAVLCVLFNRAIHQTVVKKHPELSVSSVIVFGSTYYPEMGDELKFQLVVPSHLAEEEVRKSITKKDILSDIELFSSALNQEISEQEASTSFGFSKYLGPELFEQTEEGIAEHKFVEIADVGALLYQTESWEFVEAYFSQNLGPYGLGGLNIISTSHGLHLVVTINEKYAGDLKALTKSFEELIAEVIKLVD